MKEAVIVSAVRTAVGTIGGTLKDMPAQDMAAVVVKEAVARAGIPKEMINEVILGQTRQSTEASNIARVVSLMVDLPIEAAAYTVHRQCGSGLQAINNAYKEIQTGSAEVVVAGGTESMSRSPFYLKNARYGYGAGDAVLVDSLTEGGPGAQPREKYGEMGMGITAENVAAKFGITREEQDVFALRSQELAAKAIKDGKFKDEIIPLEVKQGKATIAFDTDEYPRQTTLEKMTGLKPVFKKDGTVTAGNSSGRNDGAAAVVMMEWEKAKELGIKPMARIVADACVGVPPEIMGIGPVPAVKTALKKAGLTLDQIDLFEVNEAFAAQAVACVKELGLDLNKVNVNGGAIALGHPLGMTGAKLTVTLLHELKRTGKRYGIVTLCCGGGLGIATIYENLMI
ncbi:MAG: thiolase family protein [Clostridia bacterium]|nr:thiolase family protein [Clostridia bacterium]